MPERDEDKPSLEQEEGPSKSEIKRRMLALQALGESLLALKSRQLERMPIQDERLLQAVHEARQIRSNSARRRHLQLIGKLMRDIDPEPIKKALQAIHQDRSRENDAFHHLEQLRDDMLAAGPGSVELAISNWPQADRQQLRQLVLQHQREVQRGAPPAASRKLFRYLRELQELYGSGA